MWLNLGKSGQKRLSDFFPAALPWSPRKVKEALFPRAKAWLTLRHLSLAGVWGSLNPSVSTKDTHNWCSCGEWLLLAGKVMGKDSQEFFLKINWFLISLVVCALRNNWLTAIPSQSSPVGETAFASWPPPPLPPLNLSSGKSAINLKAFWKGQFKPSGL